MPLCFLEWFVLAIMLPFMLPSEANVEELTASSEAFVLKNVF